MSCIFWHVLLPIVGGSFHSRTITSSYIVVLLYYPLRDIYFTGYYGDTVMLLLRGPNATYWSMPGESHRPVSGA